MNLETYLKFYHPNIDINDLEITDTKGYWRVKGGCKGGDECSHAFRSALGSCGGGELTISFSEHGRDEKGRFLRPYREWEKWRDSKPKDPEER